MATEGDDPSGQPWRRPLRRYWRSLERRLWRRQRDPAEGPADPDAAVQNFDGGPPRPGALGHRVEAMENSLQEIDRQIAQLKPDRADALRVAKLLKEVRTALDRLRQEQREIVEEIDRLLGRL